MNKAKRLNVKNSEAYELAAEIARLRHGTLTSAVVIALRHEAGLAREEKTRETPGTIISEGENRLPQ